MCPLSEVAREADKEGGCLTEYRVFRGLTGTISLSKLARRRFHDPVGFSTSNL
jgi:hypothetical protein